ncbi:molybdenum cofactor guanylyltransferase MobA [Sinisalibacter aestuarii]|uniref:molybdenum cofactor guanylyltransferase MobA n=1 Tax=Sinisalibacter aestuarii TaxID=2949426 RepID=UPI002491F02F|nr:molybdenum cofactor guanylyltransferase MobA [Sinisalibacter aestuarii]
MPERGEKLAPLGVILAGGQATRMGGGDKALLDLGGTPMLAHVIRRLRPQVAGLALNANDDPARFAGFGLPVLPDSLPGFPGPLAGVLAGLDWAAREGASHIVTAAADTPFLPTGLVSTLGAAAKREHAPIALAATSSGLHPTFGLWPVSLRDDLRLALEAGARKVAAWALGQGAARADFPDTPQDPFFNVNTPEDLALARARLAGGRA